MFTWQIRASVMNLIFETFTTACVCMHVLVQDAECGEGLRRRNLSCVVHWGNWPESSPQPVAEELCGDKLRKEIQQEMEQPCFVPCLGKSAV